MLFVGKKKSQQKSYLSYKEKTFISPTFRVRYMHMQVVRCNVNSSPTDVSPSEKSRMFQVPCTIFTGEGGWGGGFVLTMLHNKPVLNPFCLPVGGGAAMGVTVVMMI